MPDAQPIPTGAPCWIDLSTSDPDRSTAFYGELFGWTVDDPGPAFGGYLNFLRDGKRVAGCMRKDPSSPVPDTWTIYLSTPDARATVTAAEKAGSMVIVPAMDVADLGVMGLVTDAGGAAVGLWQPGSHLGFATIGEAGTPGWFELHTRDYDATVAFYRDVFGWETHTMSDSADFRYTTLFEGENQRAGIMDASAFLPAGVPAHWSVYFAVDDTDKTLAQITELGGAVVQAAEDTPYGRLAQAADPTGALFKLVAN